MINLKEKERFEAWYIQNFHDGDIHPNQHLLERNSIDDYVYDPVDEMYQAWQAATQSKQSEIDELKGAIREFLNIENKYDECDSLKSVIDWQSLHGKSIENLRNLLEKSK